MDLLAGARSSPCLKTITIALLTRFSTLLQDVHWTWSREGRGLFWIVSDLILLLLLLLDLPLNLKHFPGCQFATVAMEEGAVVSRDLQ